MGLFSTKTKQENELYLPDYVNNAVKTLANQAVAASKAPVAAYKGPGVVGPGAETNLAADLATKLAKRKPVSLLGGVKGKSDIGSYMNPYLDEVLDPMKADINEQAALQRNNLGAEAVMAGAFGDSSHGIENSLLNRDTQRTLADTEGRVRAEAFDRAMGMKASDIDRQMTQEQAGINNLMTTGAYQDNLAQNKATFDYKDFLRRLEDKRNKLMDAVKAISAMPMETRSKGKNVSSPGIGNIITGILGSL